MISKRTESVLYIVCSYILSFVCWGSLAVFEIPYDKNTGSIILYILGGLSTTLVALLLPLMSSGN